MPCRRLPEIRCGFFVEEEDFLGTRLLLCDTNSPGKMSVTNDAENVVRVLTEAGRLKPDTQLLYRDSDGRIDEIRHDGRGNFLGFAPGPKET